MEGVQYANDRGLPVLKHHLVPRTKGFSTLAHYLQTTGRLLFFVLLFFLADELDHSYTLVSTLVIFAVASVPDLPHCTFSACIF